jgi:t-SNARE complex subunit (syntaxin)
MGLDDKGNEIEPLKRGEVMNAKKKCGSWQQFETDSKTLKEMQNKIAGNIEKYAVLLNELKEYNSELIENASINQPMVDVAVKEYNDIMTNIQDYAATGEFRIDKYKTEMSDVSRKSYVYIYIIWLTIAVIIIYFAVKTLMKTMKKN